MPNPEPISMNQPPIVSSVFAIDPGPTCSAFVRWDGVFVLSFAHIPNREIRAMLRAERDSHAPIAVVIEKIASYGMAVGEDVFTTCIESGRFIQCCGSVPCILVPRKVVKMHLCGSMKAKDANLTAALVDRLGDRERHGAFSKGTKKDPGIFFGFASHHWAALALAVTAWDQRVWIKPTPEHRPDAP